MLHQLSFPFPLPSRVFPLSSIHDLFLCRNTPPTRLGRSRGLHPSGRQQRHIGRRGPQQGPTQPAVQGLSWWAELVG